MKTKDEAIILRDAIQNGLKTLPSRNTWGDDNASERKEMETFVTRLNEFIESGNVPKNGSVKSWLEGPDDDCLNDFL